MLDREVVLDMVQYKREFRIRRIMARLDAVGGWLMQRATNAAAVGDPMFREYADRVRVVCLRNQRMADCYEKLTAVSKRRLTA